MLEQHEEVVPTQAEDASHAVLYRRSYRCESAQEAVARIQPACGRVVGLVARA